MVCVLGYLGYISFHTNIMGWFLMMVAVLYGFGGPFLLWSNLRKEDVVRHENQDRSFWLIIPGFLVVFYASPLEYLFQPPLLPRTSWMQTCGIVLIIIGLIGFTWARLVLKDMYSGRVRVTSGHTLAQRGPYQIIRHPAYASYIIMSFGTALGFSSLIGLLAVPILLCPGLVYRINVEEHILGAEFKSDYEDYAQRTWRLIPYIW